jgi:hypothetical protein
MIVLRSLCADCVAPPKRASDLALEFQRLQDTNANLAAYHKQRLHSLVQQDALKTSQVSVALGEAWTSFHPKPAKPIILIPGIGGSILHASHRASPNANGNHRNASRAPTSEEESADDFIVWVRSIGATDYFSRYVLGRWSAATASMGTLQSNLADNSGSNKWRIRVPQHRHGLYAIDTLAPSWVIKVCMQRRL